MAFVITWGYRVIEPLLSILLVNYERKRYLNHCMFACKMCDLFTTLYLFEVETSLNCIIYLRLKWNLLHTPLIFYLLTDFIPL